MTMLTPSVEHRGEPEVAALRILATSRPVCRADGEVTVGVPPMMSPARSWTGRPHGAGEAGRGETRRTAPIRSVMRGCAPVDDGCLCLLGLLAWTLARGIDDIACSRWRVIAVLTSVPGRTSLVTGPAEDRLVTGPAEDRLVTGTDGRGSWRRKR